MYASCLTERIIFDADRYDTAALVVRVRLDDVSLVVVETGRT